MSLNSSTFNPILSRQETAIAAVGHFLREDATQAMALFSELPQEAKDSIYGELYPLKRFDNDYFRCAEDAFHNRNGQSCTSDQKAQAVANCLLRGIMEQFKNSDPSAIDAFSKLPKIIRDGVYAELYRLILFPNSYWGCAEDAFHHRNGKQSTLERKARAIELYIHRTRPLVQLPESSQTLITLPQEIILHIAQFLDPASQCAYNRFWTLFQLKEPFDTPFSEKFNFDNFRIKFTVIAAKLGYLNLLKWVWTGLPAAQLNKDKICETAALGGHLEVLQWAREEDCPWNERTCANAALGGHLEVLKWTLKKGCPWDLLLACERAAGGGNLEMLKWLKEEGYPWDRETCANAAFGGHLEMLQWARKEGCPWNEWTCAKAALGGHLKVLKWARENDCPWSEWTCANAAFGGHLEMLQWARENGCPWNERTCARAALGGHLKVLKWARENDCPWSEWTCANAALGGRLEVLKWARENGCPWNHWTCSNAALGGHLEVLKWARENGCPWDKRTCSDAALNGHFEILKYARDKGCPWDEKTCT